MYLLSYDDKYLLIYINLIIISISDSLSFDKLLKKFKVSIVKFDVAYPYGDKHEQFGKFSQDAAEIEDLFVGEVGIKDYGDKDNSDLAERFNVKKDDYPVVILFQKDIQSGKLKDFRYVVGIYKKKMIQKSIYK